MSARRGTAAKRTPMPVWSDGIHYVRRAGELDAHAMPWFAGAHRTTASKFHRHCTSLDEALTTSRHASKVWLKGNPDDKEHWHEAALPAASSLPGEKRIQGRPRKDADQEPFAITHFRCVRANPYAQVWKCESRPGEKKAVGRRKKGGRPPTQSGFRHDIGECAVLIGREPVRDPDGSVRVFPNHTIAGEYAFELYQNAPEDEVIVWAEDNQRVGATPHIDIIYDPAVNGEAKPFSLYINYGNVRKHYYVNKTKSTFDSGALRVNAEINPEAYLAQQTHQRLMRDMADKVPTFADEQWRCRSIWEAEDKAHEVEREHWGHIKGQTL